MKSIEGYLEKLLLYNRFLLGSIGGVSGTTYCVSLEISGIVNAKEF